MAIDFNEPDLTTVYTTVLQYLRDNIIAAAKMDFTGASNIPNGAIRMSITNNRIEQYNSTTAAWTEVRIVMPSGTICLFGNSSAPTGWTRKSDWQDNAMITYCASGSVTSGGGRNPQTTHVHNLRDHDHIIFRYDYQAAGAERLLAIRSDTETNEEFAVEETQASGTGAVAWKCPTGLDTVDKTFLSGDGQWDVRQETEEDTAPYYQEMIAAVKN